MKEIMYIASTPLDEDCAQVGQEDYYEVAKIECRAYINQLKRMFPKQFETGISVKINRTPHDYGTYLEVVIVFDADDENQSRAAYHIENNEPEFWDVEAMQEMTEKGEQVDYVPKTNNEDIIIDFAKGIAEKFELELYKDFCPDDDGHCWLKIMEAAYPREEAYNNADKFVMAQANEDAVMKIMDEAESKAYKLKGVDIYENLDGVWAVRADADEEVLKAVQDIISGLAEYSILDDEVYSKKEHEWISETFYNNKHEFINEVAKASDVEEEYDDDKLSKKHLKELEEVAFFIFEESVHNGGLKDSWVGEREIKAYIGSSDANDHLKNNEMRTRIFQVYNITKNPSKLNEKQITYLRKIKVKEADIQDAISGNYDVEKRLDDDELDDFMFLGQS